LGQEGIYGIITHTCPLDLHHSRAARTGNLHYGRSTHTGIGIFCTGGHSVDCHVRGRVLNQRSRSDQRSAAAESYREQTPEQLLRRARHFVRTRLMLRTRAMFLVPVPLMFMGLYSAITGSAIEMAGRFG